MPTYSPYIEDDSRDNILAHLEKNPRLVKADIAANKFLGGGNETISARVGKEQAYSPIARTIATGLNEIDPGHTDRAISNSTYSPYHEEAAPLQTPNETFLQSLKLTPARMARMAIKGTTGTAGIIGDALASLNNAMPGTATKQPMGMPSESMQTTMDKALPPPTSFTGQAGELLGSMAFGGLDPILKASQLASAAKVPANYITTQATARADVAKRLHDAGLVLPPSVAESKTMPRLVEGIGNSSRVAEQARYINQPKINDLARQELKLPAGTDLTREVLQNQAEYLVDAGYEPIKAAGKITIGSVYRNELRDIADQFSSKSFPLADKKEVLDLVDKYSLRNAKTGQPLMSYQADDAIKTISMLRREANDAFKLGGDSSIGMAKRAIATAIENNIELTLAGRAKQYATMLQQTGARNIKLKGPDPVELLSNFREARTALAKNHAVERMLEDSTTGTISTIKAAALDQNKVPLTGNLKLIAEAGSKTFSKATGPSKGKPDPLSNMDYAKMAGWAASTPYTGAIGASMAALPVASNIARQATLSKPMQNMMMRSIGNSGGSIFGNSAERIKAGIPPQLLPLFSTGEE